MKFDDLIQMWNVDGRFDLTELGIELQRVYDLHAKYLDFYVRQKNILKAMKQAHDVLVKEKMEFFRIGATKEFVEKGWKFPAPGGKIFNQDLPIYQAADPELQNSSLKIEMQGNVVDALHDIMDKIRFRGNDIQAAIKWEMWKAGG
jgi:hypothetical protein